jgi:putative colanic acid biosynthesis acetyltransferase WcaF
MRSAPVSEVGAEAPAPLEGGATFPLSHRMFRLFWGLTWLLLASWTPPPMVAWRRLLLRLFGARIARHANVYGSAQIWYPPNLEMEDFACLGPRVNCYCMAPIKLASYALASQGSYLCGGGHDIHGDDFMLTTKPITLGERSWVAAEAFVGPGVSVGEGAVLGARGVTFHDLEAWTTYVGNPAQPVGRRRRASDAKKASRSAR